MDKLFRLTVVAKLRGVPSITLIKLSWRGYWALPGFWLLTMPVLALPGPLLRMAKSIRNGLRLGRREPRTGDA
jgi:hypothetical protein